MLIEIQGEIINPYNITYIINSEGGCRIHFNVAINEGEPDYINIHGLDTDEAMHEINQKLNDC